MLPSNWQVDKHGSFKGRTCFYVVSIEGSLADLSYIKRMENFVEVRYLEHADSFNQKYFRKRRVWPSNSDREQLCMRLNMTLLQLYCTYVMLSYQIRRKIMALVSICLVLISEINSFYVDMKVIHHGMHFLHNWCKTELHQRQKAYEYVMEIDSC